MKLKKRIGRKWHLRGVQRLKNGSLATLTEEREGCQLTVWKEAGGDSKLGSSGLAGGGGNTNHTSPKEMKRGVDIGHRMVLWGKRVELGLSWEGRGPGIEDGSIVAKNGKTGGLESLHFAIGTREGEEAWGAAQNRHRGGLGVKKSCRATKGI